MMAQKAFNHWNAIADSIRPACKQVVRNVAVNARMNVRAEIKAKNLIRTGFMLNSVYYVTIDESTYKGGKRALPQVSAPTKETEALVAVAAYYAMFPNYGTIHMAARPFWEPGIERTRLRFDKYMQLIKQKMEEAAR